MSGRASLNFHTHKLSLRDWECVYKPDIVKAYKFMFHHNENFKVSYSEFAEFCYTQSYKTRPSFPPKPLSS